MKTLALTALIATLMSTAASAATFVGSWRVDAGPSWTTVPTGYTGQEAAALLFGGTAASYVISTIDNTVLNIDNNAWVSTYGGACGGTFPCGTKVAENFKVSTVGIYKNGGDTSAYVQDWAIGAQYTNYAFLAGPAVPEPASWALMIGGFALVGASLRRRREGYATA